MSIKSSANCWRPLAGIQKVNQSYHYPQPLYFSIGEGSAGWFSVIEKQEVYRYIITIKHHL